MIRWRNAFIGVFVLVVTIAGYFSFREEDAGGLKHYVIAAVRMLQGESIYRTDVEPFAYPPLFALPFIPFAFFPHEIQVLLWYLINVVLVAFIVVRLHRIAQSVMQSPHVPENRSPWQPWLFWTLLGIAGLRLVLSPLQNQSHDLIILACMLVAVDCWSHQRTIATGIAAALGAALKATPLLFAPWLLWKRRYTAFIAMAIAVVVLCLLPDVLFPANDHSSWIGTWLNVYLTRLRPGESPAAENVWSSWNQFNQSIAGTMHRLLSVPPPALPHHMHVRIASVSPATLKVVTLGCQLGLIAWLFLATWPRRHEHLRADGRLFRFGEAALLINVMVLLSPMSSKSNFCVLVLPLAFCILHLLYRRWDWVTAVLLLFCCAVTFTSRDILGEELSARLLAAGSITWCALASCAATGYILIKYGRSCEQPQSFRLREIGQPDKSVGCQPRDAA